MAKAIRFHQAGGTEVLRLEDVAVPPPGPGEAQVRHTAIGVNFVDTYHRTGLYPLPLPSGLGVEGAGVVEAIGPGVTHIRVGDRVVYAGGSPGSYSEARNIPADRLIRIPEGISDRVAAAAMLKGLTVWALVRRTHHVQPGETVLWHAAAGGVGLIAVQWLKAIGAKSIGTVGTDSKANVARDHGCDHPIVYTREDFVKRVRELTRGEGVPVVFDSVGKSTFTGSLDCLRRLGLMVSFGNASGPVPPVDLLELNRRGSLFITRPSMFHYVVTREELEAGAGELFEMLRSGKVKVEIGGTWPLAEAAAAHGALEGRQTTGSLLLLP
jgi:NADPH2:quinone reductase